MLERILIGALGIAIGAGLFWLGPLTAKAELDKLQDPEYRKKRRVFGQFNYDRALSRAIWTNRILGVAVALLCLLMTVGALPTTWRFVK